MTPERLAEIEAWAEANTRLADASAELFDIALLLIGTPASDTEAVAEIQRRAENLVARIRNLL